MRDLEQTHWWFTARREILAAEIASLDLPQRPRILEVGCGTGGNLRMLAHFGDACGLEPDPESRRYAAAQTGIEVFEGALPETPESLRGQFDLVVAFDVIEHVADDRTGIAALRDLVKPGGRLMLTVPAHPWLWSSHDEAHHHHRRYRRQSFRGLFEIAGLEVSRLSYFNTALFPLIAAARLLKPVLGGGNDDEMAGPAWLNRMLHRIFAAEAAWLRRTDLAFGVSLLAVARRPVS
jgi:SAM-dependent methyltransferase